MDLPQNIALPKSNAYNAEITILRDWVTIESLKSEKV